MVQSSAIDGTTIEDLAADTRGRFSTALWFLAGFVLSTLSAALAIAIQIIALPADPCRGMFCGAGPSLVAILGGYFLGWALSALLAKRSSNPPVSRTQVWATFWGASVFPGLALLVLLLGIVIAAAG